MFWWSKSRILVPKPIGGYWQCCCSLLTSLTLVCGGVAVVVEKGASLWNDSFKLTLFGCVISRCCVGFASLDLVCDELYDCAWKVCP